MAATTEQTDVPPPVPPGVFVRDCAVLALGTDIHGDALAVWQFSAHGKPTGARVVRQDEAFTSRDVALRLVSFLERRAITASNPSHVPDLLEGLTATAKLDTKQWWQEHLFSPVTAFAEMCARRALYERTVTAERETGRKTDPLEWCHDYSNCSRPRDFAASRFRGPA